MRSTFNEMKPHLLFTKLEKAYRHQISAAIDAVRGRAEIRILLGLLQDTDTVGEFKNRSAQTISKS